MVRSLCSLWGMPGPRLICSTTHRKRGGRTLKPFLIPDASWSSVVTSCCTPALSSQHPSPSAQCSALSPQPPAPNPSPQPPAPTTAPEPRTLRGPGQRVHLYIRVIRGLFFGNVAWLPPSENPTKRAQLNAQRSLDLSTVQPAENC